MAITCFSRGLCMFTKTVKFLNLAFLKNKIKRKIKNSARV